MTNKNKTGTVKMGTGQKITYIEKDILDTPLIPLIRMNYELHIKAILNKDTRKIYIFCTNGGAHGLYFCLDVIQKKLPLRCSFYSPKKRIKILDSITRFNRYVCELKENLIPIGQEHKPGWYDGKYIIGDLPLREVTLLDSYNDLLTTHLKQSIHLPFDDMPEEVQDIYWKIFTKYRYDRDSKIR